eukprot:101135-Pelagomonas_calceolata.AAC.2
MHPHQHPHQQCTATHKLARSARYPQDLDSHIHTIMCSVYFCLKAKALMPGSATWRMAYVPPQGKE